MMRSSAQGAGSTRKKQSSHQVAPLTVLDDSQWLREDFFGNGTIAGGGSPAEPSPASGLRSSMSIMASHRPASSSTSTSTSSSTSAIPSHISREIRGTVRPRSGPSRSDVTFPLTAVMPSPSPSLSVLSQTSRRSSLSSKPKHRSAINAPVTNSASLLAQDTSVTDGRDSSNRDADNSFEYDEGAAWLQELEELENDLANLDDVRSIQSARDWLVQEEDSEITKHRQWEELQQYMQQLKDKDYVEFPDEPVDNLDRDTSFEREPRRIDVPVPDLGSYRSFAASKRSVSNRSTGSPVVSSLVAEMDEEIRKGLETIRRLDEKLVQVAQSPKQFPHGSSFTGRTLGGGSPSTVYSNRTRTSNEPTVRSLKPIRGSQYYLAFGKLSSDDEKKIEAMLEEPDVTDGDLCSSDNPSANLSYGMGKELRQHLETLDAKLEAFRTCRVGSGMSVFGVIQDGDVGDVTGRSADAVSSCSALSFRTVSEVDSKLGLLHSSSLSTASALDVATAKVEMNRILLEQLLEEAKRELGELCPRLRVSDQVPLSSRIGSPTSLTTELGNDSPYRRRDESIQGSEFDQELVY